MRGAAFLAIKAVHVTPGGVSDTAVKLLFRGRTGRREAFEPTRASRRRGMLMWTGDQGRWSAALLLELPGIEPVTEASDDLRKC
jgi:hypothetical protein